MLKINDSLKMTSIELSKLIPKNHYDVLRAIRVMEKSWIKIGGGKFTVTSYIDKSNRSSPMYEFNFEESIFVASKFSDELRGKVIKRWAELEYNKVKPIELPPKDISKLIEEENQKYEKQLETINTDINKYFISLSNIAEFREYNSLLSQKKSIIDMIAENNKAIKINARHKNKISALDS